MVKQYTEKEVIALLYEFADYADNLYRPYTSNNVQAWQNTDDFIAEHVTGTKKKSKTFTILEFIDVNNQSEFKEGYGHPIVNGVVDEETKLVFPYTYSQINKNATHIIWYKN